MLAKILPPLTSLFVSLLFIESPAILAVKLSISITKVELQGSDTYADAFETKDYRAFESDKTYIVTAEGELEDGSKPYHVFYWIGSQASREKARSAAAFAVESQFKLNPKTDVIRETEGRESSTFKALFEVDASKDDSDEQQSSEMVDENRTRMILIKEYCYDLMEEVAFSSGYLQNLYICFVAFNSKIVFLYCGNGVTDDGTAMRMSIYLTKLMSNKMGQQAKILKMIRKEDAEFVDEFQRVSDAVEELRASPGYEERRIASFSRNFHKNFTLVHCHRYSRGPESRVVHRPVLASFLRSILPFHSQYAYFFDSCLENIGIFIWMGTAADVDIRKSCASGAEYGNEGHECPPNRPITFINQENVTVPKGERRLRINFESLVKVMHQLGLSWTDVLKYEGGWSV